LRDVTIANNAPRKRERNYSIADCVAHFSLNLTLRTRCVAKRLQPAKQNF
jgi:hypothetical protein